MQYSLAQRLQGDRNLEVSLDIAFHALKCDQVDFRVEDSKGILYDDARVHMTKTPVSASAFSLACLLLGTRAYVVGPCYYAAL